MNIDRLNKLEKRIQNCIDSQESAKMINKLNSVIQELETINSEDWIEQRCIAVLKQVINQLKGNNNEE